MAWIERFTCDICGKLMGASESWWVAINDCASTTEKTPTQPVLKLMPWDNVMGHSAGTKHLCGAACAHTYLDRWMAERNSGIENCPGN
jgi:hypothetical protein